MARTMTPVPSQRPTRPTTTTSLAPSRTSAGVGARRRTSCSSHFASIFIPRIPFAGTTLDSRWAARRRPVIATGAGWATAWVRRRPYTVWRCSSEGHFRSSEAAQDFHSRAMDPVGRRQARQNQVRGQDVPWKEVADQLRRTVESCECRWRHTLQWKVRRERYEGESTPAPRYRNGR